jgi:hypothetical protein
VAAVPVFGMLQMSERAAELFDFVLVRIFLALGEFECLENCVHVIKGFAQCFYDLIDLLDGSLDGSWRGGMCRGRTGWRRRRL